MTTSQAKIPVKPKGFNAITASISVPNVADAVAFYTDTLGAEATETLTIPGTDTVVYAALKVSGTTIALSMDETQQSHASFGPLSLYHYLGDIEAAFEKAANNGATIVAGVDEAWWGDRTAVIIDPFGVRWTLAQRAEQLSASERAERFAAFYKAPKAPEAADETAEPVADAAA